MTENANVRHTGVFRTTRMEKIARHFVARRLGRGIVMAYFEDNGWVSIELEFDPSISDQHRILVSATPACVSSFAMSGVELLYRLIRHAISHVQWLLRHKSLDSTELELDCSRTPWNGDLTELPYGGATAGFSKRQCGIFRQRKNLSIQSAYTGRKMVG
jgi:hypothetical protein